MPQTIVPHFPERGAFSRSCKHCNRAFSPSRSDNLYCSLLCRRKARYQRRKIANLLYPMIGKRPAHSTLYVAAYGEEAHPPKWDIHHIDNDPSNWSAINLVALPHRVHSHVTQMILRGQDVSHVLMRFIILRDTHFLLQGLTNRDRKEAADDIPY